MAEETTSSDPTAGLGSTERVLPAGPSAPSLLIVAADVTGVALASDRRGRGPKSRSASGAVSTPAQLAIVG